MFVHDQVYIITQYHSVRFYYCRWYICTTTSNNMLFINMVTDNYQPLTLVSINI